MQFADTLPHIPILRVFRYNYHIIQSINYKTMLSKEFIGEMKQELLEAKKKLETELASLKVHTEMGSDQGENAEEMELDEVSKNLTIRIKADLMKIDKALQKAEQGTYGTDDEGKEISEARLRALPWADKAI